LNIALAIIALLISLALSLALSWIIYRLGTRLGIVGRDVHKSWESYAVRIGGAALVVAPLVSFATAPSKDTLALLLVSLVSGLIGLIDDLRSFPAVRKVLITVIPGLIHLLLGVYEPRLYIPLLGEISARILYIFLIPAAYAVALNAANMMDTHNGILGGSILITIATLSPIIISRSLNQDTSALIISSITGSLAGFLILNIYPAKIFVGNVGSLIIGSWIAFLGIYGRSEFLLILALFPMIINGFSIITSIGGLREKSAIKIRPVLVEKGMIRANKDPKAPITIAHLATATTSKGIRETELVISTWILFYIASIIAITLYAIPLVP
jgi:UDP-N-acetylglucosamine--dolichyl-phosphate N-acetylglucosaminephosphotransferase